MTYRIRPCAALASVFLLAAGASADDALTRTFLDQKCRYTLLGADWKWVAPTNPPMLLQAVSSDGKFVVMLTAFRGKVPPTFGDKDIADFEEGLYRTPGTVRRGGRMTILRGIPCYQAESRLADGRTAATRGFVKDGVGYHLMVVGGPEPVEADPAFEAILGGFEFTAPPEQTTPQAGQDADERPGNVFNVSQMMGRVAAACLVLALLLFAVRAVVRAATRRRPNREERYDDDDDDRDRTRPRPRP